MGLDDFVNDEEREEWQARKEELKQNTPPGEANSWIQHEPGVPNWLGFIEYEEYEVTDKDLQQEDGPHILANLLQETGDAVKIQITGVDSTAIVCTNPTSLNRMR
jgi:hypothetical protein